MAAWRKGKTGGLWYWFNAEFIPFAGNRHAFSELPARRGPAGSLGGRRVKFSDSHYNRAWQGYCQLNSPELRESLDEQL